MPPKERESLFPSVVFFPILFQLRRDGDDFYMDLRAWIGQNGNRELYCKTLAVA
jgi:hypothetical protein